MRRSLAASLLILGCGSEPEGFRVHIEDARWVVPSSGLPEAIQPQTSNNNVSIARHEGRLFMAWRSAPTHFASTQAQMFVVSSKDDGHTWAHEQTIALGADVREPLLYTWQGSLFLSFFEGGTDPLAFEPNQPWRSQYQGAQDWSTPQTWGAQGEVPWDIVAHDGHLYMTSYLGNHYDFGAAGDVSLRLQRSTDGTHWAPVGESAEVYRGGASEAAFGFDPDGDLWAVLRNEDGDQTGFGSLLCHAPADDLGRWDCPEHSDPERYDSPRIFAHGDELYMVARRDIGGPYDQADPADDFGAQQLSNLTQYSGRPKTTALYWIDREASKVQHLIDLPGAGDTAFPSVVREGPHTFRIANYSSPLTDPERTWFEGQISSEGTQLYLLTLRFEDR
jgi:hypothetical protein